MTNARWCVTDERQRALFKRGSDRFCVSVLVSVHVHLFGAKDERTTVQTENDETTQAEKTGVGLI